MTQLQKSFDFSRAGRLSVLELWTPDEIIERATPELLPKFYEDDRVERKPAASHADFLATYVCMWANTPPAGGILFIGIHDKTGEIIGCRERAESLVAIERQIKCDLVPDARFSVHRIQAENSRGEADFVTAFRVQFRDDKVIETNKREAYIRRANSRHLLTAPERRELEIERGQVSFELENCGLKYPDDFDTAAMRSWAASCRKRKEIDSDAPLHETLANHRLLKLRNGVYEPNNACALLFAKSPQNVVPGCMVRFQRIEGREAATGKDRNVVRDVSITGTIPQIIEQTAAAVESQLRTYSRLEKDGKFYTAPEYPWEALYEVVVNACVHRSYSLRGMNIFVRMFDDRFVVESPGGFPAFVTPKTIYEIHNRRNWWTMDAMLYMDLVKCENEGAKRIRRAMLENSLPEPTFEQVEIGGAIVRVTLRNNHAARERWIDSDVSKIVGSAVAAQLSDQERRIVNFVGEHGRINVSEAMRLLTRPQWHNARNMLKSLADEKHVLRHVIKFQRDPNAHYILEKQQEL